MSAQASLTLLTTQQGRSPLPIPQQREGSRTPGRSAVPTTFHSDLRLSKTHSFSLWGSRNVHLSNTTPKPHPSRRSRAAAKQRATSQAIFRPCLGYRHLNTSNRWRDHPNVPLLESSRRRGERRGWMETHVRLESGFRAAFPGWTHTIVLLITGGTGPDRIASRCRLFPALHQKQKGAR